jgi:hypothetical protein
VDVEQAAAREDLLELVFLQLVHAGAAGDDHRLDVEVVQRVGDAVEEHAVVGGDLLALVLLTAERLRIAAAQVARRQHRRGADLVEHGLRGQADLREQALGTAAREVEDGIGLVVVFFGLRMTGMTLSSSMSSSAREVRLGRLPASAGCWKWMTWVLTVGAPTVAGGCVRAVLDQAERLRRLVRGAAP